MTRGTKSVLFGAHCFFLHPFFVAEAWRRLYGFPWDVRLWVAFCVHDLGYIGKKSMDDHEGETHPLLGARIMSWLFDRWSVEALLQQRRVGRFEFGPWGQFSLLHSRYYAKRLGLRYSRLCVADKFAIALTPAWLYLPMVRATGEVHEYLERARMPSDSGHFMQLQPNEGDRVWFERLQGYMIRWVETHRDGREDQWTNADRHDKEKAS